MISHPLRDSRRPFEFLLLLGLAFFLPLYEAPKNLFWIGFVATWIVNRWREGDWGGAWDAWDTLILAWISSAYIVAFFAGTHRTEWQGAGDILRYGSVLWCVSRSGYSARELSRLAGMLLASCAIGLAWGLWSYYVSHTHRYIELHSVGHVNHSAPYIAICLGLALSWLLARWRAWGTASRAAMALVLAFLLTGLIVGASRAAIGAMAAVPFLLALAWRQLPRRQLMVPLALFGIFAVGVGAVVGVVGMQDSRSVVAQKWTGMEGGDYLSHRGTIWRRALIGWSAFPWFGTGIDNFNQISDDIVRRQVEARGESFRAEDYIGANHAHNLYLNTLAERGLFGFGVFAAVLLAWGTALWRRRPAASAADVEWMLWGASASALTIVVLAGIFNTSLHHEIALLAMLLHGAWLSLGRRAGGA